MDVHPLKMVCKKVLIHGQMENKKITSNIWMFSKMWYPQIIQVVRLLFPTLWDPPLKETPICQQMLLYFALWTTED
jgi:hypothetical protein